MLPVQGGVWLGNSQAVKYAENICLLCENRKSITASHMYFPADIFHINAECILTKFSFRDLFVWSFVAELP